jgi:hypothetical protein
MAGFGDWSLKNKPVALALPIAVPPTAKWSVREWVGLARLHTQPVIALSIVSDSTKPAAGAVVGKPSNQPVNRIIGCSAPLRRVLPNGRKARMTSVLSSMGIEEV